MSSLVLLPPSPHRLNDTSNIMKRSREPPNITTNASIDGLVESHDDTGSGSSTVDALCRQAGGHLKKKKHNADSLIHDGFLRNLMQTLMDKSLSEIICTHSSDSNSFEIKQPNLFLERVLPYRFGLRKLGAFHRRLQKYGFEMTSQKLSRLELCGVKTPKKVSRKSVRSGDVPPAASSLDHVDECSILYRHPIIKLSHWEEFYATLHQCEQSDVQSIVAHDAKSVALSQLKSPFPSNQHQHTALQLPSAPSPSSDVLNNAYKTLDNDVRLRDAGIFLSFANNKLDDRKI